MKSIHLLDSDTINKIAAGEVVERPSSVIKELVENAIDAKASAVTIEIKEGGIAMMRVTDNGGGIDRDDIKTAFVRHATSKIETAMDLMTVGSLGFRGEALSSIASVSQIELITKVHRELLGVRYCIDGGEEKSFDDIGCPDGTTIIVRNLFYNTPARRKFLKTAATEAAYINDLAGRLALSHPDVSFKFINNNQNRLHTSGNGNLRDIIYQIYGRDVAGQLLEVDVRGRLCHVTGFIGKPILSRGNRSWENYFINGRYIKSNIITKAIEDAYKTFVMIHKYPFTAFHIEVDPALIDVNVHPRKMELRFNQNEAVYQEIYDIIRAVLEHRELIPAISLDDQKKTSGKPKEKESGPEPFELQRLAAMGAGQRKTEQLSPAYAKPGHSVRIDSSAKSAVAAGSGYSAAAYQKQGAVSRPYTAPTGQSGSAFVRETPTGYPKEPQTQSTPKLRDENNRAGMPENAKEQKKTEVPSSEATVKIPKFLNKALQEQKTEAPSVATAEGKHPEASSVMTTESKQPQMPIVGEQMQLFGEDERLLDEKARAKHRLIGQVFDTYWMVEYDGKLFIIDQHAAHEKVLYEKLMKAFSQKALQKQMLSPPVILTLSMQEENIYNRYADYFAGLGFEIEAFGGREYAVRGVPLQLFGMNARDIFIEVLDSVTEESRRLDGSAITDHIATMACKAAVKGNNKLSFKEADALIEQLLQAKNPYTCPHGRPTIISLSKYELEKKFKRIQS